MILYLPTPLPILRVHYEYYKYTTLTYYIARKPLNYLNITYLFTKVMYYCGSGSFTNLQTCTALWISFAPCCPHGSFPIAHYCDKTRAVNPGSREANPANYDALLATLLWGNLSPSGAQATYTETRTKIAHHMLRLAPWRMWAMQLTLTRRWRR